ncbi:MAG: hypothetical protein FWD62_05295 [Betaproteobacteria bacterium]|nr:hypothetical protein [Betaproteobacteria bacterium]
MSEVYTVESGRSAHGGRFFIGGNRRIQIWGQSNAIGRADISDLSAVPLASDAGLAERVADFTGVGFSRVFIWDTASSAYQPLRAANNGCADGQFGVEFPLAVRWMRETTSGNLYLHKEGSSGVSISPQFTPNQWPWTDFRNRHTQGAAAAQAEDSAWVWIQGEADMSQSQEWYQPLLQALLDGNAAVGITGAATLRLLMQMAVGSAQYGPGVASAKAAIAAASPSNTRAPSMPLSMKSDNLHQNGRGIMQAGYDIFSAVFSAPRFEV